jgi:hypothetical protein
MTHKKETSEERYRIVLKCRMFSFEGLGAFFFKVVVLYRGLGISIVLIYTVLQFLIFGHEISGSGSRSELEPMRIHTTSIVRVRVK